MMNDRQCDFICYLTSTWDLDTGYYVQALENFKLFSESEKGKRNIARNDHDINFPLLVQVACLVLTLPQHLRLKFTHLKIKRQIFCNIYSVRRIAGTLQLVQKVLKLPENELFSNLIFV